jgi:putative membrane protein
MRRLAEVLVICVAAALASGASAAVWAAEPPTTAEVLAKVHRANQKEIDMGRMATIEGHSKDVKAYGKMLEKDHIAADRKVTKLAKEESVNLADTAAPTQDSQTLPMGADFDAAFAKMMLDDHKKTISELEAARDATSDEKLKRLLGELLPVLRKHADGAQRLVDKGARVTTR